MSLFGHHHAHTPIEGDRQAGARDRAHAPAGGRRAVLARLHRDRVPPRRPHHDQAVGRAAPRRHDQAGPAYAAGRADIVDRNGVLLATSLNTASLYANPHQILDAREAADKIARALPGLERGEVLGKLTSDRAFVWIKRHLTPDQQYAVNAAGVPGLYFQHEERRIYPQGNLFAHVLGFTGIDGSGLAGVEKTFDDTLRSGTTPLRLSVDVRVQHILHEELEASYTMFHAMGAAGMVIDVHTGEILALVSLPDFDPNLPRAITPRPRSTAPRSASTRWARPSRSSPRRWRSIPAPRRCPSGYDATKPIHVARFTITDYHGKNRWLSVPEIFIYSSNIGAAKMALDVGTERQQDYLRRLGLLTPATHRAARGRHAAGARALARDQHHDHRLRPRHRGDAAAAYRSDGGRGQRRHHAAPDAAQVAARASGPTASA